MLFLIAFLNFGGLFVLLVTEGAECRLLVLSVDGGEGQLLDVLALLVSVQSVNDV